MCELRPNALSIVAACLLLGFAANTSWADVTPFTQNFETLEADSANALANDGWIVFGNVFAPGGAYLYGYGTFPAPNGGAAFSAIVVGEGGPEQGNQQLSVYNDYNNVGEHTALNIVQANVFKEQTIGAADVGKTYVWQFDAKRGNLLAPSTAFAFIKTIDPSNNFALTNEILLETTSIDTLWSTYSVNLFIDAGLVNQLFQIGFNSLATNFVSSGIFYDNVVLREATTSAVPSTPGAFVLHQNVPNPFNPATRIRFELTQASAVTINVYDTAGRKITTLLHEQLGVGPHAVTWNGRRSNGTTAAAGIYHYVLETPTGRMSRSMVLLK